MAETTETLREWSANAGAWREHSGTIRAMFAPLTAAIIEDAGITTGQAVLDVAGGPGEPSMTIAEVVGPTGSVMCTDAVAGMVATAEDEAKHRGLTNVSFRQCLADALPFPDNSFDAAVSRLGAMFFPDVVAAAREMLRVLKPNGAICFVVWGPSERNPYTSIVTKTMSRYVPMPPAEPDAPGAFRFSEPGKLAGLLSQAGATNVHEKQLDFRIEARLSPEQFWLMRAGVSGTLREKLAKMDPADARQAGLDVQEAVHEYFHDDQMSFPSQMFVVSGRKP